MPTQPDAQPAGLPDPSMESRLEIFQACLSTMPEMPASDMLTWLIENTNAPSILFALAHGTGNILMRDGKVVGIVSDKGKEIQDLESKVIELVESFIGAGRNFKNMSNLFLEISRTLGAREDLVKFVYGRAVRQGRCRKFETLFMKSDYYRFKQLSDSERTEIGDRVISYVALNEEKFTDLASIKAAASELGVPGFLVRNSVKEILGKDFSEEKRKKLKKARAEKIREKKLKSPTMVRIREIILGLPEKERNSNANKLAEFVRRHGEFPTAAIREVRANLQAEGVIPTYQPR